MSRDEREDNDYLQSCQLTTKSSIQFGRLTARTRWVGATPARAALKKSVLPTSKRSGRTCARSACARRWKKR